MIKIALVGAGSMAHRHIKGYSSIPDADVVAVYDLREEATRSISQSTTARAYSDFDTMMSDEKPDLVDICVWTPAHGEYIKRSLTYQPKGILVEKPLARTSQEARTLADLCRHCSVNLYVGHVIRYFPEYAAAHDQVIDGSVGIPCAVRMRRGGPFPTGNRSWFGNFEMSGGVILDLLIHEFDWLRWTFGPVQRVYAKGLAARTGQPNMLARDYALVTLRFESGLLAHVEGTWADPGGFKNCFEVAGDEGILEYNFNQPAAPVLEIRLANEHCNSGSNIENEANPYQFELQDVLNNIKTGEPTRVSPDDAVEAILIAEAAIESVRTGRPVYLNREAAND